MKSTKNYLEIVHSFFLIISLYMDIYLCLLVCTSEQM
uniref:Uncharacterized protein n=1 Tax=Rhizophora mucronata TaxID=61149 RepID=A0A2P2MZ18_RHIMU